MAHELQTHSPHLSYRDASRTQDPGLARGRHSQVDGTGPLVRPGPGQPSRGLGNYTQAPGAGCASSH